MSASTVARGEVRLRDGVRTCLLVFVVVRLGLFALSMLGIGLVPMPQGQPVGVPGWPAHPLVVGVQNVFTATERQDALWFLRIATGGYADTDLSAAFFPLYPAAVRLVALLPGVGALAAALLVSNAAFFGSLVVMHGLTRLEFGDTANADRAVVYLALFPTAFFLMAPYSESLFLLMVLLAFWGARRDRWGLAALAGAGAGLTRAAGAILPLALVFEAIRPGVAAGAARLPARLAAAAAPAAGTALYFTGWWWRSGDFLAPAHAQAAWRPELTLPWTALARGIDHAIRFGSWWLVDAVFVVGALVVLVVGVRILRPSYLTYGLTSLALPLFAMFADRPFLSMPRFIAVIFPIPWVLAHAVRRRRIPEALVMVPFAVGWGLLAIRFMNWQYIF